jgi:outer membrane lipoprotein SlyB
VLGNQIGGGNGRTAATVAGAVGGAAVGNQVERRNKRDDEVYRVSVRLDNGSIEQFDYQRIDDLRVGDRVKVQDGQVHRS